MVFPKSFSKVHIVLLSSCQFSFHLYQLVIWCYKGEVKKSWLKLCFEPTLVSFRCSFLLALLMSLLQPSRATEEPLTGLNPPCCARGCCDEEQMKAIVHSCKHLPSSLWGGGASSQLMGVIAAIFCSYVWTSLLGFAGQFDPQTCRGEFCAVTSFGAVSGAEHLWPPLCLGADLQTAALNSDRNSPVCILCFCLE